MKKRLNFARRDAESAEKKPGMKTLRTPRLRAILLFCILHSAFCLCASAQTRSAVMVSNATGKLAVPTNFFSANQSLLNQAVSNVPGFGAGGGTSSLDPGTFGYNAGGGTNAAGLSNNLVAAIQTEGTSSTNFSLTISNLVLAASNMSYTIAAAYTNALNLGSYATRLYAQGLTNALSLGQYLPASGGAATGLGIVGPLSFPGTATGGPSWQLATNGNLFLILDTNGNVICQLTNNQQGVAILANLQASNLFLSAPNPTIKHGGTAQWIGNLNVQGGLWMQNGQPILGAIGGYGSNGFFSGMTATNSTNVNGFNQTNTAGHNALTRISLDSTLVSGVRAARWGGNPDAWEEWVTPNAVWWQDTNNQIAFRIMQGNDSIELGGNTQVDSNLTVLGGATITGNISAANLGSAAFLPATTWQGTNAALTAWQGTAPNNFIGSQGGQGSNNVFTGPLTTNLTEEGTLTAAGGQLTATHSGNITLANTGLNWLFTAANFGAVGSQNFVSHPQDGGAKFNTTSWSTNDTDAHWNMWGINPYGLNNTTNFCDIQSQAFGALDVAYIFYNVTNLQSTTTIADNWFGPTWNIIVQYAATNTAVVFPTSTNWSMSLYGGSFTWGRNSTLYGSNTVIFDELVAGTGNVTNVTADHATWYMGAGQAGTTNPVLTNGFAGSFIYVGSGTMAGIYNLNTGLFPSTGGGGNPTAGTNIVVSGSAVSVGAAVVTNSDVNARSLTNLINLHTFNTPSSNSMATVAAAVNTAAGWVTAAVTNALIGPFLQQWQLHSTNDYQFGSTILSNLVSQAAQALNALSFTNYQASNLVFNATQTGGQGVTITAKTNATIDASFDDVYYVQTNALNFSNIINVNCATNQTRRGIVHIKPNGNYTIGFNYAANCTLTGADTTNWFPVGASNGFYTLAWEIMFTNFNSNTCTYAISPPNN